MIKKIGVNSYGVVEYAVSKEVEVSNLPYLVGQGSTCIVIETGNVYMFDEGDTSWHSLVDGTVVKPTNAYVSPKIVSFGIEPKNPNDKDTIIFTYNVQYDEATLKEEKWVGKREKYNVGKHTVKLKVQDNHGHWSDEEALTFEVTKAHVAPVINSLIVEPNTPLTDEKVVFNYDVTFDEGVSLAHEKWTNKKDAYSTEGQQVVTLQVQDTNGLWSEPKSVTLNVQHRPVKPVINSITVTPEQPVVNEPVTFDYDVTYDVGAKFRDIKWVGVKELYDTTGEKVVTLQVKDTNNLWSDIKEFRFNVVS